MIRYFKSTLVVFAMLSMLIPGFGAQLAFAHDGTETDSNTTTEDHSRVPLIGGEHRSDVAKCRLGDVEKIKQFRAEQKTKLKQIEADAKTARKAAFDTFKEARKNATTPDEKKAASLAFKDAMTKLQQDRKTAVADLKGQPQPQKHDCVKPSDNGGDVKGAQDPTNLDKSCIKTYTTLSATLNKKMATIEKTYSDSARKYENQYKEYIRSGVNKDSAFKVLHDNITLAYKTRNADLETAIESIGDQNPGSFEECVNLQNYSNDKSIKVCTKALNDIYSYVVKVNKSSKKAFAMTHPTQDELAQFNQTNASNLKLLNEDMKSIPSMCKQVFNNVDLMK